MDEKSHNQSCGWRKKDVALSSQWTKKLITYIYLDEVNGGKNL
jgi:hypothetical protein